MLKIMSSFNNIPGILSTLDKTSKSHQFITYDSRETDKDQQSIFRIHVLEFLVSKDK